MEQPYIFTNDGFFPFPKDKEHSAYNPHPRSGSSLQFIFSHPASPTGDFGRGAAPFQGHAQGVLLPLPSLALCNFHGPSGPLPEGSTPLNSRCSQDSCLASSSPSQHNGGRSPFSRQAHEARNEKRTPQAAGWLRRPFRCCLGALGL